MGRIRIEDKIVGYSVSQENEQAERAQKKAQSSEDNVIRMHEKLERPEKLVGSTYKVKTPVSDHAGCPARSKAS